MSESEASLFGVLVDRLHSESTLSCEEQLSCLSSVFVLGCRNGVSVVARVDALETLFAVIDMSVASLGAAAASGSFDDALRVCSAAHLVGMGFVLEAAVKSPPDVRACLAKRSLELFKPYLGGVAEAFSVESFGKVIASMVSLQLVEKTVEEDVSVGCGFATLVLCLSLIHI